MVAFSRPGLHPLIVAWSGPALGAAVAIAAAAAPATLVEQAVVASGVAALIPAAAPPLGQFARMAVALGSGAGVAAVTWAVLYLLWGTDGLFAPKAGATDGVPALRRADAHPDAPPRRPMQAAELGTPLMEVERALPADLDQPLAAFDPAALPAVPREPVRPVAALARVPAPDPEPAPVPAPEPISLPEPMLRHEPVSRAEPASVAPIRPAAPRLAPGERIEAVTLRPAADGRRPSLDELLSRLEAGGPRRVARG